jgi:hypothetical protein
MFVFDGINFSPLKFEYFKAFESIFSSSRLTFDTERFVVSELFTRSDAGRDCADAGYL